MGALYQISFPNGKRYVGITVSDPAKRWREHRYHAKRGEIHLPLYSAMRKFKHASFEIIAVASNREYLQHIERRAISVLGTKAPFRGC